MKKHVILSVNSNPNYLFYVPLVCWAWRKFGWDPIVFYMSNPAAIARLATPLELLVFGKGDDYQGEFRYLLPIDGYQSETIAQVSRLYGACVADGYLMTSDIDMLPLSDYWHFSEDKITTWGRDLTDYHYPICYIGMQSDKWLQVMGISDNGKPENSIANYNKFIKRQLDSTPNAKSDDKTKRWVVDQDIITERLLPYKKEIVHINRGTYKNGYPVGRVDRSAWYLNHSQHIDAHLFHNILTNYENFKLTLDLLNQVWPQENFSWFVQFYNEFKKLIK